MACKYCGETTHTSLLCFNRPRQPLKNKKHIHRVGKIAAQWIETRHDWISKHSTASGSWNCYLCGEFLALETLTLDHIKSRSRHPELRFDQANLAPCCYNCNSRKGSRDLEELYDLK